MRRALPSKTVWSREGADVERRRQGEDTWQVSARVMELLQVMSLLLKVFVLLLLKVSLLKLLSLSSPLTQSQTTMPQPHPRGA